MHIFSKVFGKENVLVAVTINDINIFYVKSHDSLNVNFIMSDVCGQFPIWYTTENLVCSAEFWETIRKKCTLNDIRITLNLPLFNSLFIDYWFLGILVKIWSWHILGFIFCDIIKTRKHIQICIFSIT